MFCPDCGTWNRARAVRCTRCSGELPEISEAPLERPDEELSALRRLTGSRYRVLRRLGSGGMANVYYAEHQLLERPLVIKVLHTHLARDAEMRERFRREAEAASQLVHPHICTIIDYAEAAEAVFIVMPYLAGGSLADVLVKERTVASGPAAAVCAQVASALDYAHRRGRLVHVLVAHGVRIGAVERREAEEHLVQHDAHRIDVAAAVDHLAHRLFGRHVVRGPHGAPRAR